MVMWLVNNCSNIWWMSIFFQRALNHLFKTNNSKQEITTRMLVLLSLACHYHFQEIVFVASFADIIIIKVNHGIMKDVP